MVEWIVEKRPFAQRVKLDPVIPNLMIWTRSKTNIKKLIRREQNKVYMSEDPDYIRSAWERIDKLRKIAKDMDSWMHMA